MNADNHRDAPPSAPAADNEDCASSAIAIDDARNASDARRVEYRHRLVFVVLPAIALGLGALAGYLDWQGASHRGADIAAAESVTAARETATAMLSYNADTVEKDLNAARDRLTGPFLAEYTKLVNEVVIPGSKEKQISAVAQVPAAASVSATGNHAVALVFVDQTVRIGNGPATNTASSVRVTLDRVDDRWLVSGFEPV